MIAVAGLGALVLGGCDLGSPPALHPGPSRSIEIADVDADGAIDVVAAGAGGGVVLLNDGSGSLAGAPTTTTTDVRELALADVDGDGAVDRIEVDRSGAGSTTLLLALGDGGGGFSAALPIPEVLPGYVTNDVALADVDADGDQDLFTAGTYGTLVRYNDGSGAFTGLGSPNIPCGSTGGGYVELTGTDLEVVDFDANGDLDIVWTGSCAYPGGDRWAWGIGYGDGTGSFPVAESTTAAAPGRRVGIGVADINEDGQLDRILSNPDAPAVEVVLGRDPHAPGPTPPQAVLTVPTPAPVGDGVAADIDGDRHVDLVVTSPRSGIAHVLYGDGTGVFSDRHPVATGGATTETVAAADLDADGRTDLVFGIDNGGEADPSVAVLRNTLDGRQH
jgi:hypothetical protein